MADFCFQCNIDHFFGPNSDFAHFGEGHPEGTIFVVLCEGCLTASLYTMVDIRGWCVDPTCSIHAGEIPPGREEAYRSAQAWLAARSGPWGRVLRLWDWWNGTPWDPGERHCPTRPWTRFLVDMYYGNTRAGDEDEGADNPFSSSMVLMDGFEDYRL